MRKFFSKNQNAFFEGSIKKRYEISGKWPVDAVEVTKSEWETYGLEQPPEGMQRGADENGRPAWVPIPPMPIADLASRQRSTIETARKAAEATGVTVNAIRYAGDAGNRAALREAVDFAEAAGLTTFASWKDSDDTFHTDHPVAEVKQALNDIAARRGQLIAREGELVAQIDAAEDAGDRAGIEAVVW